MARSVSFLFVMTIVCNVLVRGQIPVTPAALPPGALNAIGIPAADFPISFPLAPAAPECMALNSISKGQVHFKTGESIHWLGKIYGGAPASGASVPANPCGANKCSITSYTPDACKSVKILVSRNEDGTICMKEATYNAGSNSVSLIKNTWLLADVIKATYKQTFGYYATIDQTGTITVVDPAPEDVKTSQNKDLVILGAGEKGEWTLFSTCCKSTVFVLYDDATVTAQGMKNFDAAINPLLAPLGIKPEDLKDVCTDTPIKLDPFIPVLPPAPAGATSNPATPAPAGTGLAAPAPATPTLP